MRRWFSGLLLFSIFFGVGTWAGSVFLPRQNSASSVSSDDSLPRMSQSELSHDSYTHPAEFTNIRLPAEFENGDFHYLLPVDKGATFIGKCDLDAQTKGPWMGLFRRGNQSSLRPLNVRFGRPKKDDFGTYVQLHFRASREARFVFNHDVNIKPGPALTLFMTTADDYDDMLVGTGFRQEFTIVGHSYVLRVSSGVTDTGSPVDVLMLESENKQDVLYYRSRGESNFGQIEWAGDLDGDKELDLIFAFFDENGGGRSSILFLSSAATEMHLVQPYAFFHSAGKGC